jgi:hypothetical protein
VAGVKKGRDKEGLRAQKKMCKDKEEYVNLEFKRFEGINDLVPLKVNGLKMYSREELHDR